MTSLPMTSLPMTSLRMPPIGVRLPQFLCNVVMVWIRA
jgi:hypothetical protein